MHSLRPTTTTAALEMSVEATPASRRGLPRPVRPSVRQLDSIPASVVVVVPAARVVRRRWTAAAVAAAKTHYSPGLYSAAEFGRSTRFIGPRRQTPKTVNADHSVPQSVQ